MHPIKKLPALIFILLSLIIIFIIIEYLLVYPIFVDQELEKVIRDKLEIHNRRLNQADLLKVTHLDVSNKGIVRLEGIEHLGRLNVLKLNKNKIKDISCLYSLKNLIELDLSENEITDISALKNLISLRDLDLSYNMINDISPIANLRSISSLNLRNNPISEISHLSTLKGLEYLNLNTNRKIKSIEPIRHLSDIKELLLRDVPVSDEISLLSEFFNLQRLNIRNCNITDFTPIAGLFIAGTLQDNVNKGIYCDIDIRDNIMPGAAKEPYSPLSDFWPNIHVRLPYNLPFIDENIFENGHDLFIYMDEDDLSWLYTRDPNSNNRLPANLLYNDRKISSEIRFRGNSARQYFKKSYNIKLTGGSHYPIGGTFLYLNSMFSDPSMLREHLSFQMFRYLDLPAPKTRYISLWINDVYEGLYLLIERVDEWLLFRNGLNANGTLVRDRTRYFDYLLLSAFDLPCSDLCQDKILKILSERFDSRGNPELNKLSDLIQWVSRSSPGPKFAHEFEERIDMEIFIDFFAIHLIIGDVDAFADDFFLYLDHENESSRWIFIPWDKDLSFGSHYRHRAGHTLNDYFHYSFNLDYGHRNRFISLFLETEELKIKLLQRLQYLMQNVFTREFFLNHTAKAMQEIKDHLEKDTNAENRFHINTRNHMKTPYDIYENADILQEAILDYIELRYAYLDTLIKAGEGQPYKASADLSQHPEGKPVFLTDNNGWVIAKLKLFSIPESTVRIEVKKEKELGAIDRVWSISGIEKPTDVELTLYYRNEVAVYSLGPNWVRDGYDAIGRQPELRIARVKNNKIIRTYSGHVNPLSNKVVSKLTLGHEEDTFMLVYNDTSGD